MTSTHEKERTDTCPDPPEREEPSGPSGGNLEPPDPHGSGGGGRD